MAKSNEYNILKDWKVLLYSIFMILLVDLFYRNHYVSRIFYIFAELNFTQIKCQQNLL